MAQGVREHRWLILQPLLAPLRVQGEAAVGVMVTETGKEVGSPLSPPPTFQFSLGAPPRSASHWDNWTGSQLARVLGNCGLQSSSSRLTERWSWSWEVIGKGQSQWPSITSTSGPLSLTLVSAFHSLPLSWPWITPQPGLSLAWFPWKDVAQHEDARGFGFYFMSAIFSPLLHFRRTWRSFGCLIECKNINSIWF